MRSPTAGQTAHIYYRALRIKGVCLRLDVFSTVFSTSSSSFPTSIFFFLSQRFPATLRRSYVEYSNYGIRRWTGCKRLLADFALLTLPTDRRYGLSALAIAIEILPRKHMVLRVRSFSSLRVSLNESCSNYSVMGREF